jgi:hypothetical protein
VRQVKSIVRLSAPVICACFLGSPDGLAQTVGTPLVGTHTPQVQRPPAPTPKLTQPNHDPKEVRSPPSPASVMPSEGSQQPAVRSVPPLVDHPNVSGAKNAPSGSAQPARPRAVERNVGRRVTIAGGVLVLPEVAYYGVPVILDVPGLGLVDVPEEEYARLYERLSSSDPEQIEAAMVSLRAIKVAEDFEIEAAQRRPALSPEGTAFEGDLSEPISFDRPSSYRAHGGRSRGLY